MVDWLRLLLWHFDFVGFNPGYISSEINGVFDLILRSFLFKKCILMCYLHVFARKKAAMNGLLFQ